MTEDPRNPQDDETPDAAGDVAEPDASAEPSEQPAPEAEAPAEPEQPAGDAEAPAEQPAAEGEAPAEAPAAEGEALAEQPAAEAEQPAEAPAEAEQPAAEAEQPAAEGEQPAAEAEQPAAEADQARERDRPSPSAKRRGGRRGDSSGDTPDVVPGAHLEPDLVLESPQETPDEFGTYPQTYDASTTADDVAAGEPAAATEGGEPAPVARTPLDLAADARYQATGKRKTAVARVILKPGDGSYTINGRTLDVFFPRPGLQRQARSPLETAGYESRMDVVAKIHGGGVSSQAGALRHGIARALVEADPNLRTELKRQGFLTRDARVKERKKAGLKKARKRPQFSKR
jgi:small subunit ribosomal protein S9